MSSCTWLSGLPQKLHLFISLFFSFSVVVWFLLNGYRLRPGSCFLCFCFLPLLFVSLPMENIRSTCCHEAYFSLVVSVAGFFMSTVSTMPYSFASGAVIQ